jgi:phosphotransferase system enzyme I (PtsI)
VRTVIEHAHDNHIWVGMCGEMCGEAMFAFLLLGFGLDEFSMPPPRVSKIRELMRAVTFEEAKKIAENAAKLTTAKEVERYLQEELRRILKEDFERLVMR